VNRKCSPRNTILQLSTPCTDHEHPKSTPRNDRTKSWIKTKGTKSRLPSETVKVSTIGYVSAIARHLIDIQQSTISSLSRFILAILSGIFHVLSEQMSVAARRWSAWYYCCRFLSQQWSAVTCPSSFSVGHFSSTDQLCSTQEMRRRADTDVDVAGMLMYTCVSTAYECQTSPWSRPI